MEGGRSSLITAVRGNTLQAGYNQKVSFKRVASTQHADIATSIARLVGIFPDNADITASIARPVGRVSYNARMSPNNIPPPHTAPTGPSVGTNRKGASMEQPAPTRPSLDTSKTGANKQQPASSVDKSAFGSRRDQDVLKKFIADVWRWHNRESAVPSRAEQIQRIQCLSALKPESNDPMWGDWYKDDGEKLQAIHPRLGGPNRGPGSSN